MTLKECLDMHINRWQEHARNDTPYVNGMIDAFTLLIQTLPEWSLCMNIDEQHDDPYHLPEKVYVPIALKLPPNGIQTIYYSDEVYIGSKMELDKLEFMHGKIFINKDDCEDYCKKKNYAATGVD